MSLNKTLIEWVKNPDGTQGYTWNPLTGCLNGCGYCYARKLAWGRLKSRYLANVNVPPIDTDKPLTLSGASALQTRLEDPFYPRFWEERLSDPFSWSRYGGTTTANPKGIFVCDMGELFGDWIPSLWQEKIFEVIHRCSQHRFYLLTKHPENLPQWSPFPSNVYLGVSVTNQEMFEKAIHYLKMVDAKVKFLSFEPLLDHIIVDKQH